MDNFKGYYENSKKNLQIGYADIFDMEEIDKRHLYINGEIEMGNTFDTIVYHIMRFNSQDKDIPIKERKPIVLYINSPGGSVTDGYGVIDAIMTSKTPVYTVNQGICFSMGFLIFLAGHKRYAMPHSEFLMHDGSTVAWDSMAKMKDRMEFETQQLEKMTREYVLSRTKIPEDVYEQRYRVEWYFLPQEAKEIGVTDFIVGNGCDIDEII